MTEAYRFVEPDNPILKSVAEEISLSDIQNPEIQTIIDRMFELAYPEQGDKDKPVRVGLAAPQIGVSKRIILVDMLADGMGNSGNLQAFINPEILETSEKTIEGYEGCASTSRVCGIVERSREVKIKAFNREGVLIEQVVEGFPAIIFQHEIDHLNGILFVDRVVKDEDLHWVEKEEFPLYRKNWKTWPKKVSREKWNEIRGRN